MESAGVHQDSVQQPPRHPSAGGGRVVAARGPLAPAARPLSASSYSPERCCSLAGPRSVAQGRRKQTSLLGASTTPSPQAGLLMDAC